MLEENKLDRRYALPERQGDKYLSGLMYNAFQVGDITQLYTVVREYLRRYGEQLPTSATPSQQELRLALVFDAYRVLSNPLKHEGEIENVPDWLRLSEGNQILEEPFRGDYLKALDALLDTRPTKQSIELATLVAGIIGHPPEFNQRITDSLMGILFEEPKYTITKLKEVMPVRIETAEYLARSKLRNGNTFFGYWKAKNVLKELEVDIGRIEETDSLRQHFYRMFEDSRSPHEAFEQMEMLGLKPDYETFLEIARRRFAYDKSHHQAARMTRALRMKGYEIGKDMRPLVRTARVYVSSGTGSNAHISKGIHVGKIIPLSPTWFKVRRSKKNVRRYLESEN